MMDLGVVMVFAVLQISLQTAGTDSSQAIPAEDSSMTERAESSRVHHLLPRNPPDKQQSATEFQSFLEWTEMNLPKDVPKDAVTVFDKKSKQTFHVAKFEDCIPCFYDSAEKACWEIKSHGEFKLGSAVRNAKISFLVNKDNFELLQWKKSSYGEIPPLAVESCNGYFIARDDLGLGYMTENSLMVLGTTENEVLTLNHDIKGHHLTITEYNITAQVTSENTEVLKHFTAYNRNCEPAKHQVKLDQGIDKTVSFLKTHTHTVGGTGDTTFKGKVPFLTSIGGKLGLKYDFSRLSSKTTSTVEKSLHSVSMEVQVPANHMCSIDIKSNTFTAEVPYTGQLTRIYNNNEIRRTLINDVYSHHEVAEIQALVNPCTLFSDGKKC
ncbi:natterin-3 [Carassius auratus]|uniref:Natterin-3 n=1 Tax=Carassius auratus TaxID=7957 RepID=A0A6P6ISJ5_CARAU|nr:natterin-3-like [Carassius auratus]